MAAKQTHLWTWSGSYFGMREGDDLWTYKGKHAGRFKGDDVFAADGRYLGEMNGTRLVTKVQNKGLRGTPFTPLAPRGTLRALAGYTANSMYPGFEEFPKPELL